MSQTPRQPQLFIGGERPGLDLFWLDSVGDPVSVHGYTIVVSIEQDGTVSEITDASVTANSSPTADTNSAADVPSVHIDWQPNSIDGLTAGPAILRVRATTQNRHRWFRTNLIVDA